MAKLVSMQNGVTRKSSSRRSSKRNPAKKTTARRSTSKAGALGWAKRNGMKLVKRSAENPRRKRKSHKRKHRRNGIVTSARRNGLLGNTKHDAQQVGGVLAGMAATKLISRVVGGFVNPLVAKVGLGNYADLVTELGVAVVVVPAIAKKVAPKYASNARLGGLAVVGISAIDQFSGGMFSQFNPFNTAPIVVAGNKPLVQPSAVAALVNSTSATPQEKAQVQGAMAQLERGVMPVPARSMTQAQLFD